MTLLLSREKTIRLSVVCNDISSLLIVTKPWSDETYNFI